MVEGLIGCTLCLACGISGEMYCCDLMLAHLISSRLDGSLLVFANDRGRERSLLGVFNETLGENELLIPPRPKAMEDSCFAVVL